MVIHTKEPASTIESTYIVVKILNSAYEKAYLDKVAVAEIRLDKYQPKNLLSLLTEFEYLFDVTLGK